MRLLQCYPRASHPLATAVGIVLFINDGHPPGVCFFQLNISPSSPLCQRRKNSLSMVLLS